MRGSYFQCRKFRKNISESKDKNNQLVKHFEFIYETKEVNPSMISFLAKPDKIFNKTRISYKEEKQQRKIIVEYAKIRDKMQLQELIDMRIRFQPNELLIIGQKLAWIAMQLLKYYPNISINLINTQNICLDNSEQQFRMFIYPLLFPSQINEIQNKNQIINQEIYLTSIVDILKQFSDQQENQVNEFNDLKKFIKKFIQNDITDLEKLDEIEVDSKITSLMITKIPSINASQENNSSQEMQLQNENQNQNVLEEQRLDSDLQNIYQYYESKIIENQLFMNQNLEFEDEQNINPNQNIPVYATQSQRYNIHIQNIKSKCNKDLQLQDLLYLQNNNQNQSTMKKIKAYFNYQNKNMIDIRFENEKQFYQECINLLIIQHLYKYRKKPVQNFNIILKNAESVKQFNSKQIKRKLDCILFLIIEAIRVYLNDKNTGVVDYDEGLRFILYRLMILFEVIWIKNKTESFKKDEEDYFEYYKYSEFRDMLSVFGGFLINNNVPLDKFVVKNPIDSKIQNFQKGYKRIDYSKRNKPVEYTITIRSKIYQFMRENLKEYLEQTYELEDPEN